MNILSQKVEIINHFDNLISRIYYDIEQSMENYKGNQVLGELKCFRVGRIPMRFLAGFFGFDIKYFDSNESSQNEKCETDNKWSESTEVIDYLTQVRQRTIYELRKVQEESLENLKSNSFDLNHIKESKDVEEMRSRLFADKFYFQVLLKPNDGKYWAFSLFTIVVDFYLSQNDINYLEY